MGIECVCVCFEHYVELFEKQSQHIFVRVFSLYLSRLCIDALLRLWLVCVCNSFGSVPHSCVPNSFMQMSVFSSWSEWLSSIWMRKLIDYHLGNQFGQWNNRNWLVVRPNNKPNEQENNSILLLFVVFAWIWYRFHFQSTSSNFIDFEFKVDMSTFSSNNSPFF